jgi:rubrerythrin
VKDLITPPAIVQDAFTAANTIRLAATFHSGVKQHGRQALAEARKAGDALIRAKAECPHGEWLPLLERTWPGSFITARRYMRIAGNWAEVEGAETVAEALRWIAEDKNDHDDPFAETAPPPEVQDPATTSGDPPKKTASQSSAPAGKQGSLFPDRDRQRQEERLSAAKAASDRKKALAQEAIAACDQLLEVLPELATGHRGPDFCELAEAAGVGPVQEVEETGAFVGTKLVAGETVTERFPAVEKLREATAAFLAKFGGTA